MSTRFFTNTDDNTLYKKFEGIVSHNNSIKHFDAIVGYLMSSGYYRIKPLLENMTKVRLLVGIEADSQVRVVALTGNDSFDEKQKAKQQFTESIINDIRNSEYNQDVDSGSESFIKHISNKQIEIRIHPDKNIHAKVYIFRPEEFNHHTSAHVITGSSNLTNAGLGVGKRNYEFNVLLNDYEDVQFASKEFEKLWSESIPYQEEDIKTLVQQTHLNDKVTPFDIYIKVLIEYFGEKIDYDPDSVGDLPINYKKLSYQIDAVNEGFNMLKKHNGFILADVVGLGKTVISAMITKKFLIENGPNNTKILVVHPPAVERNWKDTFREFKVDKHVKFVSNGSLHNIIEQKKDLWKMDEYDLIIVDEAHKFRSHNTDAFRNLQRICKSPRSSKGILDGLQKKVILVTATPLNNKPDDIKNLVLLFQDERRSTLPVENLTAFFKPLSDRFNKLKKERDFGGDSQNESTLELQEIYSNIRRTVIEPITVRRTRTDLQREEYSSDLKSQGIKFPIVSQPSKVEYSLDDNLVSLLKKTIEYVTNDRKLTYSIFKAAAELITEKRDKYNNPELVSRNLAEIKKVQLIKRLESSFSAFKKSLNNLKDKTQALITMYEEDRVRIETNYEKRLYDNLPDVDMDDLTEFGTKESNVNAVSYSKNDFSPNFISSLRNDILLLTELVEDWEAIKTDPKLDEFISMINPVLLNSDINIERKLVIFTESKDTCDYLRDELEKAGYNDVLSISSANRKLEHETILQNFDANYPLERQRKLFNILITTEVLSEGVNLHRSNVIVHYDVPWNSIKLIQRIGRVNRIGTKADIIYNFVCYPSSYGDILINLNRTAFFKIQAFHTALGEDNQIYSQNEMLSENKLFSKEAILEDVDERIKYLHELRVFKKEHPEKFERIRKLPFKIRTCRSAVDSQSETGTTVAFLKTERKQTFYKIANGSPPKEITPIEAFKIFEAFSGEKSFALPSHHYRHVEEALNHFMALSQTGGSLGKSQDLSKTEHNAVKCIQQMLGYHETTDLQKNQYEALSSFVRQGKYLDLPSEIVRVWKVDKMSQKLLELDRICKAYGLNSAYINSIEKTDLDASDDKPTLILSESFI